MCDTFHPQRGYTKLLCAAFNSSDHAEIERAYRERLGKVTLTPHFDTPISFVCRVLPRGTELGALSEGYFLGDLSAEVLRDASVPS